jgi:ABC-2 type transport system permease protein
MNKVPADIALYRSRIGRVNWIGLRTLYLKEVQRFVKVATQTLLAPVVTTLLFLAVFSLALGGAARQVGGVPFIEFLAPGLIMMAIAQNSFANTASSVLISKVQGSIVDMLMPPVSAGEFTLAYVLAGATRGVCVGIVVALAMLPFAGFGIAHAWAIVYYAVAASLMLSLLGLLGGLWADKFDHMAAVTNFVITPLAFLSGTFYSIERLPTLFHRIALANPFFFMIDGFRYGFIGHADGTIWAGAAALAAIDAAFWLLCLLLVRRGYKLKS